MADDREPPALFDDGDESGDEENDKEDLFTALSQGKVSDNKGDGDYGEDDKEDIFAGDGAQLNNTDAQTEVPLDGPEDDTTKSSTFSGNHVFDEPPSVGVTAATATSKSTKPASLGLSGATATALPTKVQKTKEEIEEEENEDQFNIEITVSDPRKVGDGMNAYMTYKVVTKTTLPQFRSSESAVYRRFSDFLGIHEKLVTAHQPMGRIVPPAPEKSVLGMTKIKMSKEEAGSADFVERRRAALERFVNRTSKHPDLREDTDFIQFLEKDGDLPKSSSTSALSSAGVMRLFSRVGDSLGKIAFKMDETDQWFDEKQQQVDALDIQLRKLHSSIEALVQHRKELAQNTGAFAKSAAMLGNAEEHTALSRALSQLAEVEEKLDTLHLDQADADFFVFSELIKDYVSLIHTVKEVFSERVKLFKNWKDAEAILVKKREAKAKLELQRKVDKIPTANYDITEAEKKVEKWQEEFESVSKTIRKEVARFERQRVKDFKNTLINYLESLMNNQQQVIKYWESFLPEAKAIA